MLGTVRVSRSWDLDSTHQLIFALGLLDRGG